MTDEPIARAEYEEYKKRLDEENKRQDKRIELLEESTKQINALTVSIEKLAQSVESMVRVCGYCGYRYRGRLHFYADWNVGGVHEREKARIPPCQVD